MSNGGIFGTETPTQWLGNFLNQYTGKKPLFSGGTQIGTWTVGGGWFDTNAQDVMSNVCNGIVDITANITAAQQDPSTWTTIDDLGFPVAVQDYCLSKGVIPNWMTQTELNAYQTNADGSITKPGAASSHLVPLAVAGGLILLSVILLARR